MYMDKGLIENKLYQLIAQFNKEKLMVKIYLLDYPAIYIHFMMEIEELVSSCNAVNISDFSRIIFEGPNYADASILRYADILRS